MGWILARGVQGIFPTHWISPSFLICGLSCASYAQLAGLSIPTFRAVLALISQVPSNFFGVIVRRAVFMAVVALLLLYDPLMLLSGSFWLSVGAVACLITWYQFVPFVTFYVARSAGTSSGWETFPLFSLCHLQLGLLWLFTPIQLFLFHTFFPMGGVANLLAVPLFSFILVPLVLFALATQGALAILVVGG